MEHSPAFLALVADAKSRIREIAIEETLRIMKDGVPHVLIDTREESEWNAGRIPGAIHLSKGIIERDIEKRVPDKNTLLILYCGGGYRSALAADNLAKMGYSNPHSMAGGWRAWNEAGYPVEQ
jgi:rhodanese-related sulfurtransferase